MFFDNEEVDITKRCKEVLVDLHKMAESKQDVTTMVAYLPQTIGNENFKNKNTFGIDSPKKYADFIFDKVESMISNHKDYVSIAKTPFEVIQKQVRRTSFYYACNRKRLSS